MLYYTCGHYYYLDPAFALRNREDGFAVSYLDPAFALMSMKSGL